MNSSSLCLVSRSARESARTGSTYVIRGAVLIGLGFGAYGAQNAAVTMSLGGPRLLSVMAWTNWIMLTIVGVGWFSAMVSEEREQETLGLLRLAGFSPLGILLGKGAGALLSLSLLVLVQIPIGVLTVTLGGVSPAQVYDIFVLILAQGALVFGLASLASVVSRTSSRASGLTMLLLLALHLGPVFGRLAVISRYNWRNIAIPPGSVDAWFNDFFRSWADGLPMVALFAKTGRGMGFGPQTGGDVLLRCAVICGATLVISIYLFHRLKIDAVARQTVSWRSRLVPGSTIGRRFGDHPVRQKEFLTLVGGWPGVLLRCGMYFGLAALIFWLMSQGGGVSMRGIAGGVFGWSLAFLVLELAVIAERLFRSELDGKTWGALYGLPTDLGTLVRAKVAGALFGLLPALLCLLFGFALDPGYISSEVSLVIRESGLWFGLSQITFGLLLTVFFSLRSARGAMARAMGLILGFDALLLTVSRPNYLDGMFGAMALVFFIGCVPLFARTRTELAVQAGTS